MGPFNRWGDPPLSAAIASVPMARPCPIRPGGDCTRAGADGAEAFVAVSEVLRVARREAVVLVALVRGSEPQGEGDALVLQLRKVGGTWRTARVTEAATVHIEAWLLHDPPEFPGSPGPGGPPGSP